jgi:hypothetical protein
MTDIIDGIYIIALMYLTYFIPLFLFDLIFVLLRKKTKSTLSAYPFALLFYIVPFGVWIIAKSLGIGSQSLANAVFEPLLLSVSLVLMRILSFIPALKKQHKYIAWAILLVGIILAILAAQFFPELPE